MISRCSVAGDLFTSAKTSLKNLITASKLWQSLGNSLIAAFPGRMAILVSEVLWRVCRQRNYRDYDNGGSDSEYFHTPICTIRFDCANRGGCCGRDCGCCERPRSDSKAGKQRFGHCTTACGCFKRFRGFEIKRDLKDEDYKCNKIRTDFFREYPHPQTTLFGPRIWGI